MKRRNLIIPTAPALALAVLLCAQTASAQDAPARKTRPTVAQLKAAAEARKKMMAEVAAKKAQRSEEGQTTPPAAAR